MNLNGTEYYYLKNAQGDILGLTDNTGTQVVSYTYDSWGKLLSIDGTLKDTVGAKNPYRYRGYRYDTETGLYYLQSRYYNLEWGRFINNDSIAGSVGELLGHNVFAYCKNSPVNASDPTGFRETRGAINPDGDNDESEVTETTVGKKARAIKSTAKKRMKNCNKVANSIINKSSNIKFILPTAAGLGTLGITSSFGKVLERHKASKVVIIGTTVFFTIVPYAVNAYTKYDYETHVVGCCVWIGNGCYYIYGEILENFDKATLDTNTFKNLSKYGFDY